MKLIEKYCFYHQHGTSKYSIKFKGNYTMSDLISLVEDAPYGYWIGNIRCIDTEKQIYEGEIHEYWD